MAATDQICQVSIRTADRETDVTLPAGIPIAELMPAVVDVIGAPEFSGRDPHLIRVCGQRLDPEKSLVQSAVHDGELLILTTAARPAPITRFDVNGTVIDAIAALPEPTRRLIPPGAGHCVLGWAAVALLVLLGRAIADPGASRHPVVGAAAALLAMTGAVTARGRPPAR